MTALAGVWVSDYYGVLVLNRDGSYEGDHIFPSGTKNMWRAEAGVLSLFAESGYSGEPLAVLRRGADVLVADGIPLKRVRMPECKIPPPVRMPRQDCGELAGTWVYAGIEEEPLPLQQGNGIRAPFSAALLVTESDFVFNVISMERRFRMMWGGRSGDELAARKSVCVEHIPYTLRGGTIAFLYCGCSFSYQKAQPRELWSSAPHGGAAS